ncbi:hypothetical protein K2173_013592 [Erythroxylum novogranatense]|uniref:RING-type domain-containing protein n=1 Tax=Erythroxylum novogranatense TaxID=1862640 RepID=A0AAV8TLQ0_9ROSI|nr:hypothetical protein K2173_013592 [Erythroxylum novogranatense]
MGGACCVAARDKNIVGGSRSEILHRGVRHSPTWSLRWDNRGRVAGEETSISWFPDAINRNHGRDFKSESIYASDDSGSLGSFQRREWHKSPKSDVTGEHKRTSASDQSISRNISIDSNLEQVKETTASLAVTNPSPAKESVSFRSASSLPTSPSSSQNHLHPTGSTTPRWPHHSPGHQLIGQASDMQIPRLKTSNSFSVADGKPTTASWSNDSTWGSYGRSSDSWSMNAFTELMATSHRERWSFDNESLGFNHEECTSSCRSSASPSVDLQACGVCLRLLTETSLWSSQKLVTCELSVVSVLTCGHVYHAECLETFTPELDKYDPACPVCTLGEKQLVKLSQKALKAEMDRKLKNKRSSKRALDGNLGNNSITFDWLKAGGQEGKDPKMISSSTMEGTLAKPFLRRYFSFRSKSSRSSADNMPKKKGFFWTRSMKA